MNVYQPGKLGIADGISLVFGIVMPRLFLSNLSNVVENVGQIFWLSMIIYTIIPLLVLYMLAYVHRSISGDVYIVCQHLLGTWGAWIVLLTYSLMFLSNSVIILRLYSEYTLLTALPQAEFQMVVVWYAVTVGILCYLGIEALTRVGYILLPVMVGGVLLIMLMLRPFYEIYNLTPWQGNGIWTGIQSGISGVGFNLGIVALFFLAPSFQHSQTVKRAAAYTLIGTGLIRIIFMIVYIMIFDTSVGGEKTMPLFEMARLVYLNQYIQRIEATFILVWVFFGLLAVAGSFYVGLYLIAVLLRLPALRPIIPIGVIVVANLAILPPNIGYTIEIDQKLLSFSNIGIYLFPTVLFAAALWKKRRKTVCTSG